MGLDMYLNGRRFLSKYFKESDLSKKTAIQELFPELSQIHPVEYDDSPVKEVIAEVGYWRKANHIHAWFVKNCQKGVDDCGYYYVGREQLAELKSLCQQVLANPERASELLPTTSGFFFGGTEYDEWYLGDLEVTVRIIDGALSLPDTWTIEYHSSW